MAAAEEEAVEAEEEVAAAKPKAAERGAQGSCLALAEGS